MEVIDDKGQQRVMTFNEISSTKEGPVINDKDVKFFCQLRNLHKTVQKKEKKFFFNTYIFYKTYNDLLKQFLKVNKYYYCE